MKIQKSDAMIRTSLLTVQMIIIALNLVLIVVVINKRKCKTISLSMWTLLVTMIVGSIILDIEVLLQYFTPTLPLCLLTPWLRELGFVIFYGAIDLKLYRILMQFRTRKAHCWTITDKDLLKYLLFGVIVVTVYLTAWTAVSLNFFHEGWILLIHIESEDGSLYTTCKPQWWNHVTEFGELLILTVGLYYGNSARNARVQFEERRFLFYAITAELTFSSIHNAIRAVYPIPFHQDVTFIAAFLRSLLTNTLALFIIFAPKVWYQKKVNAELRHSAVNQELSESLKADMADKDFREMNISEMTSDEIREELSRVYVQMGILRDKTVCKKNPHISKRKGGKKLPHRRFSLQKKGSRDKSSIKIRKKNKELDSSEISETNETNEISKSPEDSVVSNEDVPTVGSGYGICSCHSTTGIHQTTCNEFNDSNDINYGEGTSTSKFNVLT
ncbi:probable G-protein coupled receptor 158 [Myzus persicae]|uniref:probable G-protein coupled receptor 158 n=1 Tax=Myzus persicae TaxID=13164 RepID=UPI000B9324EE|nr:probable G-protein coupled receptor 158 [Myzus persicae]XP_022174166.1 probable G-protein coupled receptor 158 [Myzus persicae]XP_022174167.1 probable G-protein coupled receptor 158 [Myzus persicae]